MIKLAMEPVLKSAEGIVSKSPDFIYDAPDYSGCVYEYQGAPSCLVGHILVDLGIAATTFEGEGINADTGVRAALEALEGDYVTFASVADEVEVVPFLATLQDLQDGGSTWGEALAIAKEGLVLQED